MTIYNISKPNLHLNGQIALKGSKSISNRALIIRALCEDNFPIDRLASAKDTDVLQALLAQEQSDIYDAGWAGTTFRFMTAYLSMQPGTQILTGTERMKKRPIGILADALNKLGANIEYLENEGYPPLKIHAPNNMGTQHELSISAGTSSQFISALLMVAPVLPNGLTLTLTGKIVSRSYIEMTLGLMEYFGVTHTWEGNTIRVEPQKYQGKPFVVEADWSAASYYYAMAAFSDELDLTLEGLFENSFQGDAALVHIMEHFGVKSVFNSTGVRLTKNGKPPMPIFEYDFIKCPDIAQTLAVVCGGLGIQGFFTGLETLYIKETDRVAALQNELDKVNVFLAKLPPHFSKKSQKIFYSIEGKAFVKDNVQFETYEDHRMAMAFAPLAMLGAIQIEEPEVVIKSYPEFWEDLQPLGFDIKVVK